MENTKENKKNNMGKKIVVGLLLVAMYLQYSPVVI